MNRKLALGFLFALLASTAWGQIQADPDDWIQLFNGRNLEIGRAHV